MNRRKILLTAGIVMLVGVFLRFDLGRFLTLESLRQNRQALLDLYAGHPTATVAGFMAVYIIQTALSLPGAAILTLAAGAVFGTLKGTVYANFGATIGATLAFLLARYLFHETVQQRFGARLQKVNSELEQRGLNYLLFLRLVPVFPFFLINVAAGLTGLPLRTFFFGTMLGIIPGGFVYCNAGASLARLDSLRDIMSIRVIGSFVLLGLFALLPALYTKFKKQRY